MFYLYPFSARSDSSFSFPVSIDFLAVLSRLTLLLLASNLSASVRLQHDLDGGEKV